MAMILDPNNHPDHYNSQLQWHVMNKRVNPFIVGGEEEMDAFYTSQHNGEV